MIGGGGAVGTAVLVMYELQTVGARETEMEHIQGVSGVLDSIFIQRFKLKCVRRKSLISSKRSE